MSHEVKVPEVGESVVEGLLAEWVKQDGEIVKVDDELWVLETDKATLAVSAEKQGRLKILVQEGETIEVGQVVGLIEEVADGETVDEENADKARPDKEGVEVSGSKGEEGEDEKATRSEQPRAESTPFPAIPPSVRRLLREKGLEPEQVSGSGPGNRITRADVEQYSAVEEQTDATEREQSQDGGSEQETAGETIVQGDSGRVSREEVREKMSPLRQRIAERLVEVQQKAAILTTFNEADLTNLMVWRSRYRETFQKKHDVDLGLMSFFVKASIDALRTVPRLNSRIEGDEIVQNFYYDIGVAVSTDRGLVVPVIRDADRLSFAELELQISELARRAREKTLDA